MNIDDYSFHDSVILEVKETTPGQIVDYILDFPIDWENNKFERKTLRFSDVITHIIEEIPFFEQPCIMEIKYHGYIQKTWGSGRNEIKADRQKIEIITNAGTRMLEFLECDWI